MKKPIVLLIVLISIGAAIVIIKSNTSKERSGTNSPASLQAKAWIGPDLNTDSSIKGNERASILYGHDLIAHTSKYFGPKGIVSKITNGMNCQNCHLNAGNQPWGNNYGAVYSTYPKYRDRSGSIESIYKRVSDCMQRSLNGMAIDSNSKEFIAIFTYIKWLGKDVKRGEKPIGAGIEKIAYLNRAADPNKGRVIYIATCQICHGNNGQGQMLAAKNEYAYPPVWGENSYNDGAGLYRISNLAGYIKNNMPFLKTTHASPALTNEACWDVAAFINSMPRPHMNQSMDWPTISKKPIDYPFGPYADSFSELQHKYGPFQEMVASAKF